WTTTRTATHPQILLTRPKEKHVRLYCVAFGTLIDTNTLGQLTAQTGGRYFRAQDPASLASAFALLGKDLDGQYMLRWATLRRNATPFTPSFQISLEGRTHQFTSPVDYVATSYGTNREVFFGMWRLVADAEEGADALLLRTTYAPRNVRTLRLHYWPNYPCEPVLLSTNAGEILRGWTMTETPDGSGGRWLELNSPDPSFNTNDIPYGALGNLVQFQFTGLPSAAEAFSVFEVDNMVYPNLPGPPSFTLQGAEAFISTNMTPLIVTAPELPPAMVSVVYSNPFSAAGGTRPYTWSLTAGALPAGISLDAAAGVIHGVPLASGTNEFVLRVTGGNDLWSALSARLVVAEAPRPLIGGLGGVLGFEQGHFTFRVGGVPGQVVVLEASDNLIDWKALGTNVLESAPWEFMDPESGSLPRRFYRARLP
ncbi:MAG TPA: putative Ig domain-containing protein, partial [Verrucomicrobiota bacterium]|nr:putative Ig domain-containing protein [Verrucomicrobiota bacterium]HPW82665.1 putative Ig domain-containing protein [Verrucomicrobiota bacterium]HQI34547.1 putative Ig domain-containing protein [Verrucomicrobiota bacterium]HQK02520.1 putative Ig domain-containing protein [Verrucomicrobiota bacterium]